MYGSSRSGRRVVSSMTLPKFLDSHMTRERGGPGGAFAADDFAAGIGEFAADRHGIRADEISGGQIHIARRVAVLEHAKSQHAAAQLPWSAESPQAATWTAIIGTDAGGGQEQGPPQRGGAPPRRGSGGGELMWGVGCGR